MSSLDTNQEHYRQTVPDSYGYDEIDPTCLVCGKLVDLWNELNIVSNNSDCYHWECWKEIL